MCDGGDLTRWGVGDEMAAVQKGRENGGAAVVLPALCLPR